MSKFWHVGRRCSRKLSPIRWHVPRIRSLLLAYALKSSDSMDCRAVDLDVEEVCHYMESSDLSIVKADLGDEFIITLAPVASGTGR